MILRQPHVVLLLFSGRPNPEWTLDKDQADDVVRRLQSIQARLDDDLRDCKVEAEVSGTLTAVPSPLSTVEPSASPSPLSTVEPSASPSPLPTAGPTR